MWITYTVFLVFLGINISVVIRMLSSFFKIIAPFIYGFLIAYLLNFPYTFFKDKLLMKMGSKRAFLQKLKSPLAILLTYIIALGIIAFLFTILIPQLVKNMENLFNNLNNYVSRFRVAEKNSLEWLNAQFGLELDNQTIIDSFLNYLLSVTPDSDIGISVGKIITGVFPWAMDAAKIFTVNLYNWIIATIVSVYMLTGKEKLCGQIQKVAKAYMPKRIFEKSAEIVSLSNDMCGKFLVGKIIDSTIIGVVCFICMSIFRFDYPLIISVMVGVTNIIPFFGPFLGAIPSAFLLLIIEPVECLWFLLFIIILQQIDGNIIGPKILGGSVGVSGIWILVSVIIGGGLFGVPGMVIGVPVFAVIHTLVGENVNKRLTIKD